MTVLGTVGHVGRVAVLAYRGPEIFLQSLMEKAELKVEANKREAEMTAIRAGSKMFEQVAETSFNRTGNYYDALLLARTIADDVVRAGDEAAGSHEDEVRAALAVLMREEVYNPKATMCKDLSVGLLGVALCAYGLHIGIKFLRGTMAERLVHELPHVAHSKVHADLLTKFLVKHPQFTIESLKERQTLVALNRFMLQEFYRSENLFWYLYAP